jgi:hypothetical protein
MTKPRAPKHEPATPAFAARSIAVAEIAQRLIKAETPGEVQDIVLPAPKDVIGDAIWKAAHHDAREIARLEVELLRLRQHAELLVGRTQAGSRAFGGAPTASRLDADIPF